MSTQHNSFGISVTSRLLGSGGLAAVFGKMAYFLAVITDCTSCWIRLAFGSSCEEFEEFVLETVLLWLLSGNVSVLTPSGISILASILVSVRPFADVDSLEPLLLFCGHRGGFDVDDLGSGL